MSREVHKMPIGEEQRIPEASHENVVEHMRWGIDLVRAGCLNVFPLGVDKVGGRPVTKKVQDQATMSVCEGLGVSWSNPIKEQEKRKVASAPEGLGVSYRRQVCVYPTADPQILLKRTTIIDGWYGQGHIVRVDYEVRAAKPVNPIRMVVNIINTIRKQR